MTLSVTPADPEEAAHLLQASHALMQSLFPAESNHYLELSQLRSPTIHFLIARLGSDAVGCVACKDYPDYGEVKSFFVAETARGSGVGSALMTRLIADAKARGLSRLLLETGSLLHASHRLYRRMGFTDRGPFGDYPDDPLSRFMERAI